MVHQIVPSVFSFDWLRRPASAAAAGCISLLVLLSPTTTADALRDGFSVALSAQRSIDTSSPTIQKGNDARALEPGKPIERELAAGESHFYQLTPASGQYARVIVKQLGINVAITVFGPDGKPIVESDIAILGEPEEVSLIAEASAGYRLEVRSPDKNARKGRYEIKVEELRAASEQDKSRVAAERLIPEALTLSSQQTEESRRKAIEKLQQSLALWQSAKEPAREANALYLMGYFYNILGEHQKALAVCNQGLPLAQAAGDRKMEAYLLDTIGSVYDALGDKKKSLEFFNRALPLRQASDRVGRANTLNNIGMAYGWMGEWTKSLDFFNQVLLILRELGESRKESSVLGNICVIHNNLGEYQKALGFCRQALSIERDLDDRSGAAITLNNLGNAHSNLGEYQNALDFYTQSLAIHRALGEHRGEAVTLNNIGYVYGSLGEYEKAIDYYNQALQILRDMGDNYGAATTLSNIGVNYGDMKDCKKALEIHQQALSLRQTTNDQEGEAITLNNIAGCYSDLREKQKALDHFGRALKLHRAVGNRRHLASTLRNIGSLHQDLGENQKALDNLNEGLQISRTIGDRKTEGNILANLARLERDRGNLIEARNLIEGALAAFESLRVDVKSQRLRASLLASVRKYYEFDIDVLMRLHKQRPSEGFDAAALEVSEKGRARSLLESLSETRADIRRGVDPSLIEREHSLQQLISAKAERQTRFLSGKHTPEQAEAAAKEIDALTTEYEQVQAQIRHTSPRYAELMQPVPLNLKQIQTEAVDHESLLLEYALGEERSFLWAVTPTSINSYELPKRAEIETAARRLYEILTARNRLEPNETPEQRRSRLDLAEAEYPRASAALSQMLLGPVASQLGTKRLLIAGEGVLHYLPFAALPLPETERGREGASGRASGFNKVRNPQSAIRNPQLFTPLIAEHEVITLPSASVLAALRRETAARKPPAKTLAVLADPVFQSNDPRIGPAGRSPLAAVEEAPSSTNAQRSAAESGLEGFVRLRFSRREADEITRLAPEEKIFKALDFAASRATATSADLDQYRIVHFATHGLINNLHPELSGVVLSLIDDQGRPQNGFLRLYEIYNLKLSAELVVLSACQTALGKEIRGEGLIGLTRGFMYAGAPRVVASLWQIDDRVTAELMKRFYQGMLEQRLRPAAALRAAQVSMWKDKRWRAPHNWAAFIFQGEWK